jgi:hypothetical protein
VIVPPAALICSAVLYTSSVLMATCQAQRGQGYEHALVNLEQQSCW